MSLFLADNFEIKKSFYLKWRGQFLSWTGLEPLAEREPTSSCSLQTVLEGVVAFRVVKCILECIYNWIRSKCDEHGLFKNIIKIENLTCLLNDYSLYNPRNYTIFGS